MRFSCERCGKTYPLDGREYKCACGGLFGLRKDWKEAVELPVSLGETATPLVKKELFGARVVLKMDYLLPTGSFKDRGSIVLVNKLKELGITEVVEDSSGNAGASMAAYCAAAGIKCHVYAPVDTAPVKLRQIAAYGADIVTVQGSRNVAAKAAQDRAKETYYASHVYNPLFFEGTRSMAYEIYVQMGFPDILFVPAGNGTMLLGAYRGFKELGFLPKIVAVQGENRCPLYHAFNNSFQELPEADESISPAAPPRLDEMAAAVKESGGCVIAVPDDEARAAHDMLGKMGIYAGSTSAIVVAAARRYFKKEGVSNMRKTVLPLADAGFKY